MNVGPYIGLGLCTVILGLLCVLALTAGSVEREAAAEAAAAEPPPEPAAEVRYAHGIEQDPEAMTVGAINTKSSIQI